MQVEAPVAHAVTVSKSAAEEAHDNVAAVIACGSMMAPDHPHQVEPQMSVHRGGLPFNVQPAGTVWQLYSVAGHKAMCMCSQVQAACAVTLLLVTDCMHQQPAEHHSKP